MSTSEKERSDAVYACLQQASTGSDLIEVLHVVQDQYGYIPKDVVSVIAKKLDIPVAFIYGVITFYSRFSLIPKGKYAISVCMGTACYVKGANTILEEFSKQLGIGVGETTDDQLFSIVETRCVGQCAMAPVVNVNEEMYPFFKTEDVKKLIEELRARENHE